MKELLTYIAQNLVDHPDQVDVNRLLKQFEAMQTLTRQMTTGKGRFGRMKGMKGLGGMGLPF